MTESVMRAPRTVDIELTCRCNLRCSYCYYFDNPDVPYRELPTEDWLRFFSELGRAAVMDVTLAGGEPFIREDLPLLLQGIADNSMRFAILTNGTLVDDRLAGLLNAANRCNYVQVSLDGSCAEIHESARGSGSFAGAVNGIRTLQKHAVPVVVRVTLHRGNIHDLESLSRFVLEELAVPHLSTNAAGYLGICRRKPELMLTTEDRQQAMADLLRLCRRYPGRISAQAGPLAEARLWRTMLDTAEKTELQENPGGRLTGCGCPWNTITVRADGTYVPCSMLSHLELGRINTNGLEKVWRENPVLAGLRRRRNIPLASFPYCAECDFINICTGNCPGLAYSHTGRIDYPSPDACLKRFLQNGGSVPAAEESGNGH